MKRRSTHQKRRRRKNVRRIRAKIRAGVYENDLKLSIAIERLLGRLRKR